MIAVKKMTRGVTIVEYVLLVALIGIVAIAAASYLGGSATNSLTSAGNAVN